MDKKTAPKGNNKQIAKRFSNEIIEASERYAQSQRGRGLEPWQSAIEEDEYTFEAFVGRFKGESNDDAVSIAEACGLEIPAEGVSSVHLAIKQDDVTVAKTTWESVTRLLGTDMNQFLDGQVFTISAKAVTGNDRRELTIS